MSIEIKIRKYVSTRILSGFYKSLVDLQIVNVKNKCVNWPYSVPIWHMDTEILNKNMVLPESYMVSKR